MELPVVCGIYGQCASAAKIFKNGGNLVHLFNTKHSKTKSLDKWNRFSIVSIAIRHYVIAILLFSFSNLWKHMFQLYQEWVTQVVRHYLLNPIIADSRWLLVQMIVCHMTTIENVWILHHVFNCMCYACFTAATHGISASSQLVTTHGFDPNHRKLALPNIGKQCACTYTILEIWFVKRDLSEPFAPFYQYNWNPSKRQNYSWWFPVDHSKEGEEFGQRKMKKWKKWKKWKT